MRTLNIPMSQAAKDRLSLLRNVDALPLPLDMDSLRPFEFAFRNKVMCVTFGDADVAIVPKVMRGDRSFGLKVMLAESPAVDVALQRFFATLTRHLDAVGRFMREEQRETVEARRAQKILADQEREARIQQDAVQLRRFFVPGDVIFPEGQPITEDDCVLALRYAHPDDPFVCEYGGEFYIYPRDVPNLLVLLDLDHANHVRCEAHPQYNLHLAFEALQREGLKLNIEMITAEVIRMRDRALAIDADNQVNALIETLPNGEYKIETFAFRARPDMVGFTKEFGNVTVEGTSEDIKFYQNGCLIHQFEVAIFTQTEYPETAQDGLHYVEVYGEAEDFMDCAKAIGNLLISGLAEANPEINFGIYKDVDVSVIEIEAQRTDAGYGF